MPDDFPVFLPQAKFMEYLRLYADKFDLRKYIRLRTEVVTVERAKDFADTGRWTVVSKDVHTGKLID